MIESWENTSLLEQKLVTLKDITSLLKEQLEEILKVQSSWDSSTQLLNIENNEYLFWIITDSKLIWYIKIYLGTKELSAEIRYVEMEDSYRKEWFAKKLLDNVFPFLVERGVRHCWTQSYTPFWIYLIKHITFLSEKYDIEFTHWVQTC